MATIYYMATIEMQENNSGEGFKVKTLTDVVRI